MRLIQEIGQGDTGSVFCGEVTSLPGCADIAVSHALYCRIGRGRDNAVKAGMKRMNQLRNLGYMAVVCTVVEGNKKEEHTLSELGYSKLMKYDSERTGNTVWLWGRAL